MPIIADWYQVLSENPDTKHLAVVLARYVTGSAAAMGGRNDIDLDNKYIVLLIIMAILLFLGCFMDGTSIQLVMVPILVPIANAFGIDLILLGVVVALAGPP